MSSLSAVARGISQSLSPDGSVAMEAGMNVLKKAQDTEAQNALQLVQSAVSAGNGAPATNNPPHLGNNVDLRV
ncbi:MAG: YjfB family protein [Rhodocyclaceae bacterium]|nr:YjfB family protein [Rhodocyclaceae bacterium]